MPTHRASIASRFFKEIEPYLHHAENLLVKVDLVGRDLGKQKVVQSWARKVQATVTNDSIAQETQKRY